MTIRVEVSGPWACFSRPELRVERVSYDMITPSAARGLIEAIYFHPGLRWHIDRIFVLSPIRFSSIRRNEVAAKLLSSAALTAMNGGRERPCLCTGKEIQQRASLMLRDVHYVIEAHFELTDRAAPGDNEGKFQDIVKRRLLRGQNFYQPYLGVRECPARYSLYAGGEVTTAYPEGEKDLGYMLYDMDYSDPQNIQPMFFRAVLRQGVLDLRDCEVIR